MTIGSDNQGIVLSICLPTFNRARYLRCLLDDLSAQISGLGFSYELLIGDNASTDETQDIVVQYLGRLNIKYFRRENNVGGAKNLDQLYSSASGRYVVYLADDDFLIIDELQKIVAYLEANPVVGAVFAPWFIYDRLTDTDHPPFYTLDQDTLISQGDQAGLLDLLLRRHIFPEIYIARRALQSAVDIPHCRFVFPFFTRVSAMVDRAPICFNSRPFYRSVTRYFDDEERSQVGTEQTKEGWDCYRGGLEFILARFVEQLSPLERAQFRERLDHFTAIRMRVALRFRTHEEKNWIENYFIANRVRSFGGESALQVPYESYRVNAAFEYLLLQNPFSPLPRRFAFFADDPPKVLSFAKSFINTKFLILLNQKETIPKQTIVLTSTGEPHVEGDVFFTSEIHLLEQFP